MVDNGKKSPTTNSQKSAINPVVWRVTNELNKRMKALDYKTVDRRLGKVTPEEMLWITKFLETGNLEKASYFAYGDKIKGPVHARNMGMVKLDKPAINNSITEIMEIDSRFSSDKLLERISYIVYDSDNETNSVALIKEILKMKGAYAPERVFNVNVNKEIGSTTSDADLLETLEQVIGGKERTFLTQSDREGGVDLSDELAVGDGEETR